MSDTTAGWADEAREVGPPPWILGHRGTPREAPENTLSSLRRALEIGLEGFEYDVHGCKSGEAILLHDETLDRTTDASGPLSEKSLLELAEVDAGSWFGRAFRGESLPLLEEALEVGASAAQDLPLHMIELKQRGLVALVAARLHERAVPLGVRIASFLREVVLEARDHGLPTMLLAEHASEADRQFVREERLSAYGLGPGGWDVPAGRADWSFCERWGWSIDLPEEQLRACREPYFGFNTNEPYRALATRALVRLAPGYDGPYPLRTPDLVVVPEALDPATRERGEWYGSWDVLARVVNPFEHPVRARLGQVLQGGVFDIEGLPVELALQPGQSAPIQFRLTGGSRSPGSDPALVCSYHWRASAGRSQGTLTLDAPLFRRRLAHASTSTVRLALLAERAGDPPASILMRRRGGVLLLSLEGTGGLEQAHIVAHLDGSIVRGGKGLRLRLPEGFDRRTDGVAFSCGIEGVQAGERRTRRWAGGIPEGIFAGQAGWLLPEARG